MHLQSPLILLLSLLTFSLAHSPVASDALPPTVAADAEPVQARAGTRSYAIRSARGWKRKNFGKKQHTLKRRTGKSVRRLSVDH